MISRRGVGSDLRLEILHGATRATESFLLNSEVRIGRRGSFFEISMGDNGRDGRFD